MTTVISKDLLATCQEWTTLRQHEIEAHSKLMHSIINALPMIEKPDVDMPRRDRPVLVKAAQSDVVVPVPLVEAKPKKTRAKRTSEADIRKAVKLVFDEDLSQKEAEIVCDIPTGSLSKGKGKQIMDGYRKEWGTPTSVTGQRGARKKDVEKANRYENR
jgi:hypothetical protein